MHKSARGFTLIRLPFFSDEKKRSCECEQKDGFTLIELLVVIAIIAVLAAVVVIILNPLELTRRSRDTTRLSDMEGLQKALNIMMQDSAGEDILCNGSAPCAGQSNVGTRETNGTGWVPVNLGSQTTVQVPTLPIDPSNTSPYFYRYSSDGTNYELNAVLESEQHAEKMETDGGDDPEVFETGTRLDLI